MTKTEQRVIKVIDEKGLIASGDSVLVAFSGVPDSIFLLHFLLKFRKKYKIEIGAFHLNHMLRGRFSDKDEIFCREFCQKKKIPFFSSRVDIKKKASDSKVSIEEAGRNSRYELLDETASCNGYTKIATGHNLDDNTETVLLNLFKGTGIKGISGIPYTRGIIIRPLLGLRKPEITEFLKTEKIPFLTDKSNQKNDYERNYIRNRILPLIRDRINPSVDDAILRSSDTFKEFSRFIERKTAQGEAYVLENEKEIRINLRKFNIVDKELKGGIIKNIIERNFITSVTFNDILSVLSLSEKESGKSLLLRGNIKVFRDREHVFFSTDNKSGREAATNVGIGEKIVIDGKTFSIEEWSGKPEFTGDKNLEFVDREKTGDEFIIRPWKAGDRFKPLGMKGTVKVSDFLNSIRIPSSEKKRKMVLTNKNEIIWVIGSRINENFKINKNTRRVLKLCLM